MFFHFLIKIDTEITVTICHLGKSQFLLSQSYRLVKQFRRLFYHLFLRTPSQFTVTTKIIVPNMLELFIIRLLFVQKAFVLVNFFNLKQNSRRKPLITTDDAYVQSSISTEFVPKHLAAVEHFVSIETF